MCISSKNKQHLKYLADGTQIFLPDVTMVLGKTNSNRPMTNGDTAASAIYNISEFHFNECLLGKVKF